MTAKQTKWIRCKKSRPCPVCKKLDWCGITEDGKVVRCMRIESSNPSNGGWIHYLDEPIKYKHIKIPKPKPVKDFTQFNCQCIEALVNIEKVADELGVSVRSLERLDTGWYGNVTWPMRDENDKVIGIRVRASDGKKWCVPGSRTGVFWPENIDDVDVLLLSEGPTDTAALLTLDYAAAGRPSCSGGVEILKAKLSRRKRYVVVVADNDEAKLRPDGSEFFPGQEGACKTAEALSKYTKGIKIVVPPVYKDVRRWLNEEHITKGVLDALIENTSYL